MSEKVDLCLIFTSRHSILPCSVFLVSRHLWIPYRILRIMLISYYTAAVWQIHFFDNFINCVFSAMPWWSQTIYFTNSALHCKTGYFPACTDIILRSMRDVRFLMLSCHDILLSGFPFREDFCHWHFQYLDYFKSWVTLSAMDYGVHSVSNFCSDRVNVVSSVGTYPTYMFSRKIGI